MDGATLSDANLTNSYFSSSFIGVNGFGSPAESKYSMMQVQTDCTVKLSMLLGTVCYVGLYKYRSTYCAMLMHLWLSLADDYQQQFSQSP